MIKIKLSAIKLHSFSKNILKLIEPTFPIQADIFEVGTKWRTEVKSQGSDCRHASHIFPVDKIIFIFSGDPIYIRTHGMSNKKEYIH